MCVSRKQYLSVSASWGAGGRAIKYLPRNLEVWGSIPAVQKPWASFESDGCVEGVDKLLEQ